MAEDNNYAGSFEDWLGSSQPENIEFNEGFKKLIENGAIEADSVSQAIEIIKKGNKIHKSSLDDFK